MPRVRDVLGGAYRSMLLHGSIVMGDFQPGWSDVDVCVVLADPLTSEPQDALKSLLRETDLRFLHGGSDCWISGQTVDAIYVHVDEIEGRTASSLDAFDWLSLAESAKLLDGRPVEVARPARSDLLLRHQAFLGEVEHPAAEASAIWFASMITLLARALALWRDGEFTSKTEALEREIDRAGPEAQAYGLAREIRRSGSASAAAHHRELRGALEIASRAAVPQLRGLYPA